MSKRKTIFSGDNSIGLWNTINAVGDLSGGVGIVGHQAVYHLGCKCQELETVVEELEARVKALEKGKK